MAPEDDPRLPQTPDNVGNNRKLSTAKIQAAIIKCTVDLADLGTVGVTRQYTVCQNVNVCIYGESSGMPPVANSMEVPISNLGREIGYLESDSRDYRQSIHMDTRPQFRHYIWRKYWHEIYVFSTKTRRSMLPLRGTDRPCSFVSNSVSLLGKSRSNLSRETISRVFHSLLQSLTQISRQYETAGSNCLLPHSAHSNTSCLGLGRLQLIHEPRHIHKQFKGPVVTLGIKRPLGTVPSRQLSVITLFLPHL